MKKLVFIIAVMTAIISYPSDVSGQQELFKEIIDAPWTPENHWQKYFAIIAALETENRRYTSTGNFDKAWVDKLKKQLKETDARFKKSLAEKLKRDDEGLAEKLKRAKELSDEGDVPIETPKPKIDNKALFQSNTKGEEEANNPNPVDENSLYLGAGRENESTHTANIPLGADHRQPITHTLSGRSVSGGFPLPVYGSQNQGNVVVEVTVNQDGKVTTASTIGKGSTTQDAILWKAAEEAAKKARFNVKKDAPISQRGTIIYIFSLK
jgi:TonB family protein